LTGENPSAYKGKIITDMDDRQLIEQTRSYIRLALPLMSKHNIPITPRNYSVWYKYVSSGVEELTRIINGMIEAGDQFSEEVNEALYRRFCAEKGESELRKIREDLQQVLLTILGEVTDLTGQTEEYERFVSNSVNRLSEDASIQEIRGVIGEIIDKTRILGKFGKSIRNKLEETTEALEMLKKDFAQAKTEATVDFLTEVANRRSFDSALAMFTNEATLNGQPLSLLLIDIDWFKRFNDEFGHLVGDEVLKFMARKIKEMVRGRDLLARFGGEEFAVILPQTPIEGARIVAESIRSFFSKTSLKAKGTARNLGNITVSIGVTSFRPGEPAEAFIHRADRALYAAKETGKNRVSGD
jgi:diguanylate cyclase